VQAYERNLPQIRQAFAEADFDFLRDPPEECWRRVTPGTAEVSPSPIWLLARDFRGLLRMARANRDALSGVAAISRNLKNTSPEQFAWQNTRWIPKKE